MTAPVRFEALTDRVPVHYSKLPVLFRTPLLPRRDLPVNLILYIFFLNIFSWGGFQLGAHVTELEHYCIHL